MNYLTKTDLKEAIMKKLDESRFDQVQAAPEELSNYALLNIERNCDLKSMVDNMSVFMGESAASSFCKWLLSYTDKTEDTNNSRYYGNVSNRDNRSYNRSPSPNQLTRKPSPIVYHRVNRSWADRDPNSSDREDDDNYDNQLYGRGQAPCGKEGGVSPDDGSVKQIPSVVSTSRMVNKRKNNDPYDRRGATHMFLRAVGEAGDNARQWNVVTTTPRYDRNRLLYEPYRISTTERGGFNPTCYTGDLRDKINAARRSRKQHQSSIPTSRIDLESDNAHLFENYPATRKTTRLTKIEATLTDQQTSSFGTLFDENVEVDRDHPMTEPSYSVVAQTRSGGIMAAGKKRVRCKFWPNCARGDSCIYVHPKESCKLFPNCSFGSACLYIHPDCPNDGTCSDSKCIYMHNKQVKPVINLPPSTAVNRNIRPGFNPFTLINKPSTPQSNTTTIPPINNTCHRPQVCYFDATCSKPGCPFLHPNRNRFTCKSAYQWIKPSASSRSQALTGSSTSVLESTGSSTPANSFQTANSVGRSAVSQEFAEEQMTE